MYFAELRFLILFMTDACSIPTPTNSDSMVLVIL
nr:MAG TPA: hypothetical protein [Caudoviricetes sp.]